MNHTAVPPDYASDNSQMPHPYVEFFSRSVERREPDGSTKYVDEDWVKVTASGGRDTLEKPAEAWLKGMEANAAGGRVPRNWPTQYRQAFEQWKKDGELPVLGTPIKTWPPLTPAQRQSILTARIFTVEDLALANDEAKGRIGMGSERLVSIAKKWVEEAKGPGALAARLDTALAENEGLAARVKAMEEQVQSLLALVPKDKLPPPVVEKPGGTAVVKET